MKRIYTHWHILQNIHTNVILTDNDGCGFLCTSLIVEPRWLQCWPLSGSWMCSASFTHDALNLLALSITRCLPTRLCGGGCMHVLSSSFNGNQQDPILLLLNAQRCGHLATNHLATPLGQINLSQFFLNSIYSNFLDDGCCADTISAKVTPSQYFSWCCNWIFVLKSLQITQQSSR